MTISLLSAVTVRLREGFLNWGGDSASQSRMDLQETAKTQEGLTTFDQAATSQNPAACSVGNCFTVPMGTIQGLKEAMQQCTRNTITRPLVESVLRAIQAAPLETHSVDQAKFYPRQHEFKRSFVVVKQPESIDAYVLMTRAKQKQDLILGWGAFKTAKLAVNARDPIHTAVVLVSKNNEKHEDWEQIKSDGLREIEILKQFKGVKEILQLIASYTYITKKFLCKSLYKTPIETIHYLVERCDESLDKTLRRRKLPGNAKQKIMLDVLRGIGVIHEKGYLHCDIKPGNILIKFGRTPQEICAKLCDFGATRKQKDYPALQRYLTTYPAPEQAYYQNQIMNLESNLNLESEVKRHDIKQEISKLKEGLAHSTTIPSDLFAIGIVFFRLTASIPNDIPWEKIVKNAASFRENAQNLGQNIDRMLGETASCKYAPLVKGLMQPDPEQRWDQPRALQEVQTLMLHEHEEASTK